jgi:hypothetical protein
MAAGGAMERQMFSVLGIEAPVEERDEETGRITRTTENRDKRRGVPQGWPLSSFMSNLYLRRFPWIEEAWV